MLKFVTLVYWMNTYRYFSFFENLPFGPFGMHLSFRAAWGSQKLPNNDDIWHTCRWDEYLGVLFFFFENLLFWALGTHFFIYLCICSKTLEQPSEVKNGLIMLKFGTPVDWINT